MTKLPTCLKLISKDLEKICHPRKRNTANYFKKAFLASLLPKEEFGMV